MVRNPSSTTHRGWAWDEADTHLEIIINGTQVGSFRDSGSDLVLDTNGITVTAGGITVTAGGLTVSAGTLNIDGAADFAADVKFNLTITAGADGVGTDGEQLTSGGAAAEVDWAAASCLREFKNIGRERTDAEEVLAEIVSTPVYDFKYKTRAESDEHIISTGDVKTTYTGIMADEAPWATHYQGRILNPINTFGYTVLAFKALDSRLKELEAA